MCLLALKDQELLLQKLGMSKAHIDPALSAVAGLGSSGRYPANVHRELMIWLGEPATGKAVTVPVPIRIAKPGRMAALQELNMGIILPHVEFAQLFEKSRSVFNKYVLGNEEGRSDALRAFWEGALSRNDPRLTGRPMCLRPGWQEAAVPLAIHGDAVACISVGKPGTQSLDTVSWASAVAVGTTLLP
jgi:hypothetical protein